MKQFFILIISSLLIGACSTETPETVKGIPEEDLTKTKDGVIVKQTLVSAGKFSPSTSVKFDGHNFDLVIEKNDSIYMATSDTLFLTHDKYHVGMTWSEIPKALQKKLQKETGWGYYIELPSGWSLGFCEGASCTDMKPTDSSKVKWLFKRK
ncbi:hypothetical protein [Fluviicola sp.]|uniref:hypothetical protein n=1 Tax=Fluviicola sp. TaxID=1917219 RepID=UPI003D2CA1D7